MAATDKVVCINHHVCCTGHPEAISRHPEYLALFGPASERLALYTHGHDHRHDQSGAAVPLEHAHDDHG
jgi:zinc transport system ATP-binding protein